MVFVYLIMYIHLSIHICYVYLYIYCVHMYPYMLDAPGSIVPGRDLHVVLLYNTHMYIFLIISQ